MSSQQIMMTLADEDYVPDSCDDSDDESQPERHVKRLVPGSSDNSFQSSETGSLHKSSVRTGYGCEAESDKSDMSDIEMLREKVNQKICIKRVLASSTTMAGGKKKKHERVYSSLYQYCVPGQAKVSAGDPNKTDTDIECESAGKPSKTDTGIERESAREPRKTDTGIERESAREPRKTDTGIERESAREPRKTDTGIERESAREPRKTDTGIERESACDPSKTAREPRKTDTGIERESARKPRKTDAGIECESARDPSKTAREHRKTDTGIERESAREPSNTDTDIDRGSARDPSKTATDIERGSAREPSNTDTDIDRGSAGDHSKTATEIECESVGDPSKTDTEIECDESEPERHVKRPVPGSSDNTFQSSKPGSLYKSSVRSGYDSEAESDESDLSDTEMLREKLNSKIYIKRVLTSSTTKTGGKKKKHERVYNSYQFCIPCQTKVSNFSQHIKRNVKTCPAHQNVKEIHAINQESNAKRRATLLSRLRAKYNHEFNLRTIRRERGEIMLDRRPRNEFVLTDYGPCPNCFLWVAKKLLRKHQKSCIALIDTSFSNQELMMQSYCLSGQLRPEASQKLVKEVFAKMLSDEVASTVKGDVLIIQLGNQWMEKNVGNILKRGAYTSQILRLVGRFLINLRKVKPIPGIANPSLWDYLKPEFFQSLVNASLLTACPLMDDEDNLKTPSNAIKLGYDIKRLINGKLGMSIIKKNPESQHDAEQLLKLMNIYWGTRVAKLARVTLEERRYYAEKALPLPEDIAALNKHLRTKIAALNYEHKDKESYRKVAVLIESKLVLYNRRRTGELQSIRLPDYARRCQDTEGLHFLGGCTDFEKKLLETQEVMTVRGKVGRPVPVIIPEETKEGLAYLCDAEIRTSAGIGSTNEYVFASGEASIVWAYESVKSVCQTANLKAPGRITSTNMRKYMATIMQLLDLRDNQMQWVLNHLGHTMDVHKLHYRATSDLLERTQIAKILLLQDQGRVGEYKNKCLDDIQLEDVVFPNRAEPSTSNPDSEILQTIDDVENTDQSTPDMVFEALEASEVFFPDSNDLGNDSDDLGKSRKPRKRPSRPVKKVEWVKDETDEILRLFKPFFDRKTRPKPHHCVKAIEKSKKASGFIWKRKKDVLKKKVFRMIDKLNLE